MFRGHLCIRELRLKLGYVTWNGTIATVRFVSKFLFKKKRERNETRIYVIELERDIKATFTHCDELRSILYLGACYIRMKVTKCIHKKMTMCFHG